LYKFTVAYNDDTLDIFWRQFLVSVDWQKLVSVSVSYFFGAS